MPSQIFAVFFSWPLLAPQYSVERLEGIVLGHCEDRRYDGSESLLDAYLEVEPRV